MIRTIALAAILGLAAAPGAIAKGHDQGEGVPMGGPFGGDGEPLEGGGQATAGAAQQNLGRDFGAARADAPGGFSGAARDNNPSDADAD